MENGSARIAKLKLYALSEETSRIRNVKLRMKLEKGKTERGRSEGSPAKKERKDF